VKSPVQICVQAVLQSGTMFGEDERNSGVWSSRDDRVITTDHSKVCEKPRKCSHVVHPLARSNYDLQPLCWVTAASRFL